MNKIKYLSLFGVKEGVDLLVINQVLQIQDILLESWERILVIIIITLFNVLLMPFILVVLNRFQEYAKCFLDLLKKAAAKVKEHTPDEVDVAIDKALEVVEKEILSLSDEYQKKALKELEKIKKDLDSKNS
jgi:hypothetical protein